MKQFPKNIKYKKLFKKRFLNKKIQYRSNKLQFGFFGLKAINTGLISFKHLEAGRKAINQKLKRTGKIWIRVFPFLPLTSKPIATRMGKGKGNTASWVCHVKAGTILYEINIISETRAKEVLLKASIKLPLKTKIIKKLI